MAKTSLRSKLTLAFIAVSIIPLLLLVAELGVRVFAKRLDPLAVFVSSPQLRSDTQGNNTSGMFEFDPLLTWRLKPNLKAVWWDFTPVQTNALHLRMNREVGAKAGLRIVCLGDSVTFGYRVPVAHDRARPDQFDAAEKPYPALLEEMLRARFPGKTIEVLPLACPGYTSRQGAAWLRQEIDRLQPDLVTACFGWNDVRVAGLPDRATFPTEGAQVTIRRVMAHSQLLLQLAKSAQSARATDLLPDTAEPRSSVEEYVQHFTDMQQTSKARGAWFGIVAPVYRDPNTPGEYPEGKEEIGDAEEGRRIGVYREKLQSHALQHQIPIVVIPELTEAGWPGNQALFGERIHPNAAGHKLMAERLVEFLAPEVTARLR